MSNTMNYENFAPMFGKWAPKFRKFIESQEFYDIYQKLKVDSQTETILPSSDHTFKVFEKSDPDEVKVVWYLMDPYPRRYKDKKPQATGIALDCSNTPDGKLQPSLTKFYDAMSMEMEEKVEYSASLDYLLDQGNLMMNTDLTVKLGKSGSHERLWESFQKFFLEEVMSNYTGIIYVLCGKPSHRMERYIMPLSNYIFKIEHPAAADYAARNWKSEGIFKKINQILKENNGKVSRIFWNRAAWEEPAPF